MDDGNVSVDFSVKNVKISAGNGGDLQVEHKIAEQLIDL